MPKRKTSGGNQLDRLVVRTRQPVLIRDNYVTEVQNSASCPALTRVLLSVALVAYDRAFGRWQCTSDQEHVFDEGI